MDANSIISSPAIKRPNRDTVNIEIAKLVAKRTTCARRSVGAVGIDIDGHVLGTGYNGQYTGSKHCNEGHLCPGANSPSGTNIDGCAAIHAEQNLLLHCGDPRKIHTVYVTTSPCTSCLKLLLGTNTQRIVFCEDYPGSIISKSLWTNAGRLWEKYSGA
jgi:dCMP deaminase